MDTSQPKSLVLPDLLSPCPFPLSVNVHMDVCASESLEWMAGFWHWSDKQKKKFNSYKLGLLAAMAYPGASYHGLRIATDWLSYVFWLDDYTDSLCQEDAAKVRILIDDIFRHPEQYEKSILQNDASVLIKITYDFWTRMLTKCNAEVRGRFIATHDEFLRGICEQCGHRDRDSMATLEEYIRIRRDDAAVGASLVLVEYGLGLDLTQEILDDPVIKALELAANDVIGWANDIYSFNKEQAYGDRNLLVFIVMRENGLTMQEAFDFVGDMICTRYDDFVKARKTLPSWGNRVDKQVAMYIDGQENWIVGSIQWPFETRRYFGAHGGEIRQHRLIELQSLRKNVQDMSF